MPDFEFYANLYTDTGEVYSLLIPKQSEGFYRFSEEPMLSFLQIEAKDGLWYARCNPPALFVDSVSPWANEILLNEEGYYAIENDCQTYGFYVMPITPEYLVFHNHFIVLEAVMRVGSSPGCEVVYKDSCCAPIHAVLQRANGSWSISSEEDRYGTYVNGKRVMEQTQLHLGDMVQISGMRMIIGTDFLSISACPDCISISGTVTRESPGGGFSRYSGQSITTVDNDFYNRTPRRHITLPQRTITIEGPPMSVARAQMPLMLRMGSSLIMGGTSALAGNYTMLLSSVLFPFLSSKYTDEQKQKYDHLREVRYREYLELKRMEIRNACQDEKEYLNRKYPPLPQMLKMAASREGLWDRRSVDDDFLSLRVGQSERTLSAVIDYPQKNFTLETDELEEEMYRLAMQKYVLADTPATLALVEDRVCGLVGDLGAVQNLVLHLSLQIAALHSYDEVKMLFLCDGKCANILEYIRYLPHTWDDNKKIRFIATNEAEAFRLGEYLQNQLPEDLESDKELRTILKNRPYYVVFAMGQKEFDSIEVLKQVIQADEHHGISVITAYGQPPKECSKLLQIGDNDYSRIISLTDSSQEDVLFTCDYCPQEILDMAKQTISNTQLKTVDQAVALPKMVTFLEMFQAGRIEHLNPLKRWHENNPVASLSVPIGVGTDGLPFYLDLHEEHQGPHGLVAGMTGSGKSEFLITYILSLAVNFHPHEVAFVLIDYKGGGLAGAFENPTTGVRLPHLVGTITNLDGNAVRRSIISLESEVRRRQEEFNKVKSIVNEGTMDIYGYQKLYRAGKLTKPMPHLFIISDEFAELKQQQPEFIEQLISIARIGRSLGIHLILATQKPSGVVNDQIRSNTKFRACLRVQDRADSMDMLKRPEAAELTDTGRFYLQVGYNEYFALAQSAWCGAPYEPQDVVRPRRDDSIEVVDHTGQRIAKAKPKVMHKKSGMKQLVAVVKYLSDLAKKEGIPHDPLWEEELPKLLKAEEIQEKYPCNKERVAITLGMLDDPERQTQMEMALDLTKCGNILIAGNPGSGKTTLLQTMLYLLIDHYSPEEVQFYGLDYSSRLMKRMFRNLPHCGGILDEDGAEDLDHFFRLINDTVTQRKKLFTKLGVDNYVDAVKKQKLPLILVFIDNLVGLGESRQGELHSFRLPSYLKDCASYGIKYVVSVNRMNQVPAKLRLLFGERIALNMKDTYDYSDILETKVTYMPAEVPGRGLYAVDGRPLEMQCAIFMADTDSEQPVDSGMRIHFLTEACETIAQRYAEHSEARRLPVISEKAEFEDFVRQFARGRFPLGYDVKGKRPIALPFKQFSGLSLYLGNSDGIPQILKNISISAEREHMTVWAVCKNQGSVFLKKDGSECVQLPKSAEVFEAGNRGAKHLNTKLLEQMNMRAQIIQHFAEQCGEKPAPEAVRDHLMSRVTPILILIESTADLASVLDATTDVLMSRMLASAWKMGIYCIGLFEPEDYLRVNGGMFYRCFNADGNILLLGGRFDKQQICDIPTEEMVTKQTAFNVGIMQYRSKRYPMLIPCGEIKPAVTDADLESIF